MGKVLCPNCGRQVYDVEKVCSFCAALIARDVDKGVDGPLRQETLKTKKVDYIRLLVVTAWVLGWLFAIFYVLWTLKMGSPAEISRMLNALLRSILL